MAQRSGVVDKLSKVSSSDTAAPESRLGVPLGEISDLGDGFMLYLFDSSALLVGY